MNGPLMCETREEHRQKNTSVSTTRVNNKPRARRQGSGPRQGKQPDHDYDG